MIPAKIKANFYPILLLVIGLIMEIIINPVGNFPLNDDWSYALPIYNYLKGEPFKLINWGAMTLIAQIGWGMLISKIFYFDFTILRLSTVFLSYVGVYLIFKITLEISKEPAKAFLFALVLLINPYFFSLSNTFMTEIPFMVCEIGAYYYFYKWCQSNQTNKVYLAALILVCTICVLIRQIGIIFPLSFVLATFSIKDYKQKLFPNSLPLIASFLAIKSFEFWVIYSNTTLSYYKSSGHAIELLLDFQEKIWPLLMRSGITLNYLGLFLLPLTIPFLLNYITKLSIKQVVVGVLIAAFPVFMVLRSLIDIPIANMIYNMGIGPLTLADALELHVNENYFQSPALFTSFKILFPFGGITLVFAFVSSTIYHWQNIVPQNLNNTHFTVAKSLLLTTSFILLFLAIDTFLFDRHILPLLPIFIIAMAFTGAIPSFKITYYIFPILIFAIFTLLTTKDYLEWNRTRWNAINYMLNEEKINPKELHGGFEYSGWYNYNELHFDDWFYKDLKVKQNYVVVYGKIKGYECYKSFNYQRFIPLRKDSISILKKQTPISD